MVSVYRCGQREDPPLQLAPCTDWYFIKALCWQPDDCVSCPNLKHFAVSLHPGFCAINLTLTHLSKAVIQINYSSRPRQHPTSYQSPACLRVFLISISPSTEWGLYLISHSGGRCLSLSWAWRQGINLAGSHVSRVCSVWILVKHITVEPNAAPSHTGRLLRRCPSIWLPGRKQVDYIIHDWLVHL